MRGKLENYFISIQYSFIDGKLYKIIQYMFQVSKYLYVWDWEGVRVISIFIRFFFHKNQLINPLTVIT